MRGAKEEKKFNWPLVGLFLFAFVALLGSLAIMLNVPARGTLVVTRVPLAVGDERAFLWKEDEHPLPVIIDNMKDSWPPEGLEYARVVFEAPVEAGITRLLAIFGSDEEKDFDIGPVRSARPYFVDWAKEFGTILAHVGGSDAALAALKQSNILDLDEFRYGGKYFNRVSDRFAPHSTMTSLELLKNFFEKVGKGRRSGLGNQVTFNKWITKDDATEHGSITAISIPYKEPYTVRWEYNAAENKYLRFVNGEQFLAASGEQISAKNIVVMKTLITIIDNLSRRKIVTDGGGEALIFQDGKAIEGRWKKENGFTRIYDEANREIAMNRGLVWVEVVGVNTDIIF